MIRETNDSEPEGLIDTLKTINEALMMIVETSINNISKEKEEQIIKYINEQLLKIETQINKQCLSLEQNK